MTHLLGHYLLKAAVLIFGLSLGLATWWAMLKVGFWWLEWRGLL